MTVAISAWGEKLPKAKPRRKRPSRMPRYSEILAGQQPEQYNELFSESPVTLIHKPRRGLHMRMLAICVVLLSQFSFAQNASNQEDTRATAYCDFEDSQEVSIRYNNQVTSKDEPRNGRVWMPGGSAMTLFTHGDPTPSLVSGPTYSTS